MEEEKTNFKKVVEFNETFGVPVSTTVQNNVFTENPDLVKLRFDLIDEEVKELKEAINNGDMVETIDALADILYVVYGAGASFGIDLDKAFDMVHKSNMSKTCISEEEAERTVQWYIEQFEEDKLPYDSPAWRLSDDGRYYVVYNQSTGKILKNINYNAVDFTDYNN